MIAIPEIPTDLVILESNSESDDDMPQTYSDAGSLKINDSPWCIEVGWAEKYIGPIRAFQDNKLKLYSLAIGYLYFASEEENIDFFQSYSPNEEEGTTNNGRTFESNGYSLSIVKDWMLDAANNVELVIRFTSPEGHGPYDVRVNFLWSKDTSPSETEIHVSLLTADVIPTHPNLFGFGMFIDAPVEDPIKTNALASKDYFELSYYSDTDLLSSTIFSPDKECSMGIEKTSASIERMLFADDSADEDYPRNTIYFTPLDGNYDEKAIIYVIKQVGRNEIKGMTDGNYGNLIENINGEDLGRKYSVLDTEGADISLLIHIENAEDDIFDTNSRWLIQWRGEDGIQQGHVTSCNSGIQWLDDNPFADISPF